MALSCIVLSKTPEIPPRIVHFLENARFFEVKGVELDAQVAIEVHKSAPINYLLVDIDLAKPALQALASLSEWQRPRTIIFGAEESYFLDRSSVEPVLFDLEAFFPSVLQELEANHPMYTKPVGKVQLPSQWLESAGTLVLETKPVWMLMEPGQWIVEPAAAFGDLLYLRIDNSIRRIKRKDLLMIEAQKDYLRLTTKEGQHRVLRSLKSIEHKLDPAIHCRVHRSYIILLEAVHSIEQEMLWVDGIDQAIPIGPNYRKELLARLDIL